MSSFGTGSLAYNDGKIKFTVPWGRPAAQEAGNDANDIAGFVVDGAVYWSNTTFDPIAHGGLLAFLDVAAAQPAPPKRVKVQCAGPLTWATASAADADEGAACDMFEKTSTEQAPWILVEGNDKEWARAKVVRSVAEALEAELDDA